MRGGVQADGLQVGGVPVSGYYDSQVQVVIIVNSSELCVTDFDLREVIPLQVRCTRGTPLKQIGIRRYVLS
jgi:hypothetical protein